MQLDFSSGDGFAGAVTTPLQILRNTFGFQDFRGVQEQVIGRVMGGARTLAVMPTGSGKSLCYQVPSLALPGTVLVISPLIALMHDQIRAAEAFGLRAASLTSADGNRAETIERLKRGELELLYVAPERATGAGFRELIAGIPLALIAIDEAHCVSEWGHDFRPDYRLLLPLLDAFADVPRLALTATADKRTRDDILVQLGIPRGWADRRRLRPAQYPLPCPSARRADRAIEGTARRAARGRHRLRHQPRQDRADRRAAPRRRPPGAALSCRARAAAPRAQPGGVRQLAKRW